MAINTSRLAYQDCYDLMERAISDEYPTGLRIKFASWNEANHFRQRIHNARYVDRQDNADLYDKTNIMHGRSVYDVLNCRIRQLSDGWWLRLERVDARKFEVEPLESPEMLPPEAIPAVISINGGQQVVAPVMRLGKFKRRF
jgi:hypothetical protein